MMKMSVETEDVLSVVTLQAASGSSGPLSACAPPAPGEIGPAPAPPLVAFASRLESRPPQATASSHAMPIEAMHVRRRTYLSKVVREPNRSARLTPSHRAKTYAARSRCRKKTATLL